MHNMWHMHPTNKQQKFRFEKQYDEPWTFYTQKCTCRISKKVESDGYSTME